MASGRSSRSTRMGASPLCGTASPNSKGVVDVVRITRMLKTATTPASPAHLDGKVVQLALPRFARPEQHFETRTTNKKEGL